MTSCSSQMLIPSDVINPSISKVPTKAEENKEECVPTQGNYKKLINDITFQRKN